MADTSTETPTESPEAGDDDVHAPTDLVELHEALAFADAVTGEAGR